MHEEQPVGGAASLRTARIQAVRHMAACEQAHLRWSEPTITEIVIAQSSRAFTVVPFTQPAEALSGADWVWWWVDGRSAYGMLVQAKRVTVTGRHWDFGFEYKIGSTERFQRDALRSTAEVLNLLPVYALYLGTAEYRCWESCSALHRSGRCLSCVKRSLSLMPELLASDLTTNDAPSVYEGSVAMEDIWEPTAEPALLLPSLMRDLPPDLLHFLETRQDGTRAITRAMTDRVLRNRYGAFSAPSSSTTTISQGGHDDLGPVFSQVPDDTGHFGVPYFRHVLGPFRHVPPGYVLDILTNELDMAALRSTMPDNVAGIVVAQVPYRQKSL